MAPPGSAAAIHVEHRVVSVTGLIDVGDSERFEHLEADLPKLVVRDSPGGEVQNALAMAELIHRVGIPTLIPAGKECLSACAMLFLAGSQRYIG